MRKINFKDLRVQRTLAAIDDVFIGLILDKTYKDITVSEICNLANIRRKTFYSYYDSLDDLLAEKITSITKNYLKRIYQYDVPRNIKEINTEFYCYSEEQGPFYERIVCCQDYNLIGNNFLQDIVKKTWENSTWFNNLDYYHQNIILAFMFHTGGGIYRQWVQDGKNIPLASIISYSENLLCAGFDGFMTNAIK